MELARDECKKLKSKSKVSFVWVSLTNNNLHMKSVESICIRKRKRLSSQFIELLQFKKLPTDGPLFFCRAIACLFSVQQPNLTEILLRLTTSYEVFKIFEKYSKI